MWAMCNAFKAWYSRILNLSKMIDLLGSIFQNCRLWPLTKDLKIQQKKLKFNILNELNQIFYLFLIS